MPQRREQESVSDKPLKIIPGGLQDPNYNPPELIVIKADDINISESIALTEGMANVLFINSSSGAKINCFRCRLENFGRITFASATSQSAVNQKTSSLGKLSTISGSTIAINGLETNGAYSLELLAEQVNTSGTINTHVRGTIDPSGGYTQSDSGDSIIAVAGVNLYMGALSVNYETLELSSHEGDNAYTKTQTLDGQIKAGMINVISASPILLKSSAVLSTTTDLLSSTMHHGELHTLLEGVYIQTTQANSGSIRLDGKLASDNLVQILAQDDLVINNSLHTHRADVYSGAAIKLLPNARLTAERVTLGGNWLSNRGQISANNLSAETVKTLYNHFGGSISANDITLSSLEGAVINGSRTNKYFTPVNLSSLPLTPEFTADDKYGIYGLVNSETGSIQQNITSSITGNNIRIKGLRFENINPYHLTKPEAETWNNGVNLDTKKSRNVVIEAERSLQIDTSEYALNSSAILGLNQAGSMDINTPLFMNQRYRIEAILAVYSRISYDQSGGIPISSRSNQDEIETYLTAYSPPGVVYSFGEMTFSNGENNSNSASNFVNQFSFIEILSDAHFHNSTLHSMGLAMAARQTAGFEPVRCATHGCASSNYISLIESETLTTFGGNVFGLSSDLVVQTVNQLEDASKQELINAFVQKRSNEVEHNETFANPTGVSGDVTTRHYLSKWEITSRNNNETLVITISRCNKIEYYYSDNVSNTCTQSTERYPLSSILTAAAGGNLLNGLPWTGNEVRAKATDYVSELSHRGSLSVAGYNDVQGTFVAEYVIFKITDDNEFIVIDYNETFDADNQSSLSEAQSRTSGYYRKSKSVTVRLTELMGSIPPPYRQVSRLHIP